jgi:hypothetical protein
LPAELLQPALQAAANIGDESFRSSALVSLSPHLPAELLPQALQAASDVESRAAVLARWVAFPSAEFTRTANDFLDRLSTCTRRQILRIHESLQPIVAALAEKNAPAELTEFAKAIADVGRWWP